MPKKKHEVILSPEERGRLKTMTHTGGNYSAKELLHAQVLLLSDDGRPEKKLSNRELSDILEISPTTVNSIRRAYAENGLEAALRRKTRITPPVAAKLTGDVEAKIIATALGPAPDGYDRWTLRLLAEKCMERQYVVEVSHTAIGSMLNSNQLKPHLSKYWCIPKEHDASFVAAMEDVLRVYHRPYDKDYPVICMDEKPVQLLGEIRDRISAQPMRLDPETGLTKSGYCEKQDYEYRRGGTASIFMFTESLGGWRHVVAREHRTKGDWSVMMREVAEKSYPDAKKIILVADNLNTHTVASFYEAFPAHIAGRLAERFEIHYTPRHGSWLNIAETELGSLSMQCLGHSRIDNLEELNERMQSWAADRNAKQVGVTWQFNVDDARVKLKRLYPEPIFTS